MLSRTIDRLSDLFWDTAVQDLDELTFISDGNIRGTL
jgi:hypothetical protein